MEKAAMHSPSFYVLVDVLRIVAFIPVSLKTIRPAYLGRNAS